MGISCIAVGARMPAWVDEGVEEYARRIRKPLGFSLAEIPLVRRGGAASIARCVEKEGQAMLAKIHDGDHVIALEVSGRRLSTAALAERLARFQAEGGRLAFLVGGPDGLHDSCRARADEQWSLSDLTLPHALVRLLLAEQLYRAHSLLRGHPYHRS